MSEKRQRQQQRRRRRKAQRSGRPSATHRADRPAGVDDIATGLARIAEIAADGGHEPADALEAEHWASCLIGSMHEHAMFGADVEEVLVPRLVDALERLGGRGALATLRCLGAVARPEHGRLAHAAAGRLSMAGLPEPAWAAELGHARPTAAALIHEEAFDDGVSVLVEFTTPGAPPHTVAVYIDHNLGGLVKHVFLAGPLAEIRPDVEREAAGEGGIAIRELDLAEARARVEAALDALDHTYDPPIGEGVQELRALVAARLRALPHGFELPADELGVGAEERNALLADFLASSEGARWRTDDDAADVVELAIDFGSDYNHGGALRWSPVVVDIFMTSWLPRKVACEREFFEHVPVVLADWVRYAGRRRGVPDPLVAEAVATVTSCRGAMLEAVDDPIAWGPAKALGIAARDAGVDLTDPEQLARFVEEYNDGLAA